MRPRNAAGVRARVAMHAALLLTSLLWLVFAALAAPAAAQSVSVRAVVGVPGYTVFVGDGQLGHQTPIHDPACVVATGDASRSDGVVLWFSERLGHRVRRMNANGLIATHAGDGSDSFYGDGGAATDAALQRPNGIAVWTNVTSGGARVWIADAMNDRIRFVNESGIITTVAGGGSGGWGGNGGAATDAGLVNPT
ncbi:hypothetical protein EON67_08715, partial [archaeon]